MSCVPTSPSKSESVIISGPSPIFTGQLCAPCKPALCIKLTVLNLILDCLGLKLAMAVYGGFPTKWPLFCVPCVFYVFVWSGDVTQYCFWPIKAWDGPMLKIENTGKAPAPP